MSLTACLHLPVSLSYPEFPGMAPALALVHDDVAALDRVGFDAVLIENDADKPHTLTVNEAQVAWLTRAALAAKAATGRPVGIGVQRIDWRATLAVAAAAELDFVRLDVYVDTVNMLGQQVEVSAPEVLAWRRRLRADHVELWVDVHVKHALLVSQHPIGESVRRAAQHGAAAVLVTGDVTGEPPRAEDLKQAHGAGVRVLVGSGLTPENAAALRPLCHGAVVGTALKVGDRIGFERARSMVEAWRSASPH